MVWLQRVANVVFCIVLALAMQRYTHMSNIIGEINEHQYTLVNVHTLCEYDLTHYGICMWTWEKWIDERYPPVLRPLAYSLLYTPDSPIAPDSFKFETLNATLDHYAMEPYRLNFNMVVVIPEGDDVQGAIAMLMERDLVTDEEHSPMMVKLHPVKLGSSPSYYLYTAMQYGTFRPQDTDDLPSKEDKWLAVYTIKKETYDGPLIGVCGISAYGITCAGIDYDEPFKEPDCLCSKVPNDVEMPPVEPLLFTEAVRAQF